MLRKLLRGTGISFSWKRLLGITGLRLRVSRKVGIPTTLGGLERRIGRGVLNLIFGIFKK